MKYQGLDLPDERDDEVALEAIVLLKVLTKDGVIHYREYKTASLHAIEALGMATTLRDTLATYIMRSATGGFGRAD